jgi:hypothetical protein
VGNVTYRPGLVLALVLPIGLAIGCSHGKSNSSTDGGGVDATTCTGTCDQDGDGVPDGSDQCPNTKPGAVVNGVGCSDAQLMPVLNPMFPPYGLMWTTSGDLGRAGGLTWTYTGINRGDLFHIYWVFCDDPMDPCGISLAGPINPATDSWAYDATTSNLAEGKLSFTDATSIMLSDGSNPALTGRLTVNITGENNAPIFFNDVGSMHIHARDGLYGAEIPGTGFTVTAIAEIQDPSTQVWTPYMDWYDAEPMKPDPGTDAGGNAFVSFGGSFYDK